MSTVAGPGNEVLRGMHVEAWPLHLTRERRGSAAPSLAQVADPPSHDSPRKALEEAARQGREEGARAGYEEGLRRGLGEAAARSEAAVKKAIAEAVVPLQEQQARLDALCTALHRATDDCLRAAEDEMVALCYETLCRVVGASALRPESVRGHLLELASSLSNQAGAAIHVNPQDAALLSQGAGEQPSRAGAAIRWVADPEVALGGCMVKTAAGGLDARLETMLANCKRILLAVRESRAREGGAA
jgi:flagellar assembly protein FliH